MTPPAPDLNPGGISGPASFTSSPVQFSPRVFSLDVLRGIALLGALFVSIWIFGGFSTNQQETLLLQSKGLGYRFFGAAELLLSGKMGALIAMVFGASMLLFLTRDHIGPLSTADLFIRRQMWLAGFGLVNAVIFLWTNDLLFHLGIMGILLFPIFRLSARTLLVAALVITLIYSGRYFWNYADDKTAYSKYLAVTAFEKKAEADSVQKAQAGTVVKKDSLNFQQKTDKQAWEGIIASKKPDLKKDAAAVSAMRAMNYGKVWNYQLPTLQAREAMWTYEFGIWDLGSMILLGMALFKLGFFNGRFSPGTYSLVGMSGIAAGLLLGWLRLHEQQLALQDYIKFLGNHALPFNIFFPFERLLMSLGYAGMVMLLLQSRFLQRIWRGLAAAGKMALTNYLVQSIFLTLYFNGYGMGFYGRLNQFELYFLAAEVCLVQIVFSIFWLQYYHYGPAEWLLRRLAYGKGFRNRKVKPAPVQPEIPLFS